MPQARFSSHDPDTWYVYTDGSARTERRQTFSGWAARAVQPETREFRQISGGYRGGGALEAETEAILAGLRLVPRGAVARLYSDLEEHALLAVLQSPAGEAARAHLRELWVQAVMRNSAAHAQEMHRLSRVAEQQLRAPEDRSEESLPNAVLEAQGQARAAGIDAPLPRAEPRHLPGEARPLELSVCEITYAAAGTGARAQLHLELRPLEAWGRDGPQAYARALRDLLGALAPGGLARLRVPAELLEVSLQVAADFRTVRLEAAPERADTPPDT
ncbi:hypothetical protein HNR42_002590 [Deinobacterium chartae]|uniref:Uncharacterized protein n=1 Tax=Deinobacterium chartae TaxID=521158 RepID=A0A841I2D1_9DEIO|nr:hypothetical protein [Deinobacterium chartae]MBB6099154.1 hypothetical protein [Deinobacterium chartae]